VGEVSQIRSVRIASRRDLRLAREVQFFTPDPRPGGEMEKQNWKDWLQHKFHRPRTEGGEVPAKRQESFTTAWDTFFRDPFAAMRESERWFGDFTQSFKPVVDVVDEGKRLRVTAELPGMGKDDVEVSVDDGRLLITGEKKIENVKDEEGCYRVERSWGSFSRGVPLPRGLDLDTPKARFDDGVLSVTLDKLEAPKSNKRKVEIS
jgi:HSP20 family protein